VQEHPRPARADPRDARVPERVGRDGGEERDVRDRDERDGVRADPAPARDLDRVERRDPEDAHEHEHGEEREGIDPLRPAREDQKSAARPR